MLVVSNTSPIMNLAVVGMLDLLRQQFGEVIIPAAGFYITDSLMKNILSKIGEL